MGETYSTSMHGGDFIVITESAKGTRGWVFSHLISVPESDYDIFTIDASVSWDGDPTQDEGAWDTAIEPTRAVDRYCQKRHVIGIQGIQSNSPCVIGVKPEDDLTTLLVNVIKDRCGR